MTGDDVISAIGIPNEARVDRRVAKTLLIQHGAITTSDKQRIYVGIEELKWIAALKPHNIGAPPYRDEIREYLEISVLSLTLRADAKALRLNELIHRAIPYPVLLITEQPGSVSLSVAQKRSAENEAGRVVLDGPLVVAPVAASADSRFPTPDSLSVLALAALPKASMYALYQGWQAALEALLAAQVTGRIVTPPGLEAAAARREALAAHTRLTREIAALRAAAAREKQTSKRVELNLKVKRLEAELVSVVPLLEAVQ